MSSLTPQKINKFERNRKYGFWPPFLELYLMIVEVRTSDKGRETSLVTGVQRKQRGSPYGSSDRYNVVESSATGL